MTGLGIQELYSRLRHTSDILWGEFQEYSSGRDPVTLERIKFHLEIIICFLDRSTFDHDNSLSTSFRRALALLNAFCETEGEDQSAAAYVSSQSINILNQRFYGRCKIVITQEQLEQYLDMGFNCPTIATLFGVSVRTVRRRMADYGLSVMSRYSTISDDELDHLISELKHEYPSSGYRIMLGLLKNRGIKVQQMRVRRSMQRIDPCGAIIRRFDAIHRRAYHVLGPLTYLVYNVSDIGLIKFRM